MTPKNIVVLVLKELTLQDMDQIDVTRETESAFYEAFDSIRHRHNILSSYTYEDVIKGIYLASLQGFVKYSWAHQSYEIQEDMMAKIKKDDKVKDLAIDLLTTFVTGEP